MAAVHLLLLVAWLSWIGALFLPALDRGRETLGWQALLESFTTPQAFLLVGMANVVFLLCPLLGRGLLRRRIDGVAGLALIWMAMAVFAVVYWHLAAQQAVEVETAEGVRIQGPPAMRLLIGGIAWIFALVTASTWLVLCHLAARRRR